MPPRKKRNSLLEMMIIKLNGTDWQIVRLFHWKWSLLLLTAMITLSARAVTVDDTKSNYVKSICPIIKIDAERLTDLNVPRSGHSAFLVNGELTVVGGHTSGFVLTQTAEYFKDGKWHLLQTVYPHDGGFYVILKSGKVLLAGGFKDNLGIGQSYEVEIYDPITHTFEGLGCLDQKRASATALELDSGHVLITGNWYADDGMELFDGHERFNHLKPVCQSRYLPRLFRTSNGDVMIVGLTDNKGQLLDTLIVERMKGEPFRAPLLDTWRPLHLDMSINNDDFFIGDMDKGIYAYLMPVMNKNGKVAIAEVRDTIFSLLPTDGNVPTKSQWGKINYYSSFYADRKHQCGYVMGCDSTGRQYALRVDYSKKPAQLTLYHTDPLTNVFTITVPVITEDGNLILTGIKSAVKYNFNFTPTPQVWLLRFHDENQTKLFGSMKNIWLWSVLGVLIVLVISILFIFFKHKYRKRKEVSIKEQTITNDEMILMMMQRITELMETNELYKVVDLKLSDVALKLNANGRYVSECIKKIKGCSFKQYIISYRIEHAQQLMRERPDKKMSSIYLDSGFINETTFFRAFKSVTGMTPKEWMNQQNQLF